MALLSFNWRAMGGHQSSVISVDDIFALQGPMSASSSLPLQRIMKGQFAYMKCFWGFAGFKRKISILNEKRTRLIDQIRSTLV